MSVVAILISDLHLSTCPPARSAEPDWFDAMGRMLDQIKEIQNQYNCCVLCAGDVFDRHDAKPSLVNWAIENLPEMIAIPGQHDLPYHSLDKLEESAFWTLVQANIITPVGVDNTPCIRLACTNITVWGFPWGQKLTPMLKLNEVETNPRDINVALVHSYVWVNKHRYPGAPGYQNVVEWKERLAGWDVVVFGDNHQGFACQVEGTSVINCGCLIPRKSDERDYKIKVGLIRDDGTVWRRQLDTTRDKWLDLPGEEKSIPSNPGMVEFIEDLNTLSSDSLDFRDAVIRYMEENSTAASTKQVLTSVMDRFKN